jgi:hypothetical protein
LNAIWRPPPSTQDHPDQYLMTVHIRLGRDHRLIGRPEIQGGGAGPLFDATRESIMRALSQGQPYDMLSLTTYEVWKDMDIDFNPKDAFGG